MTRPAGAFEERYGRGTFVYGRPFQTLDVFTETALAGNPLAVVLDADGLDDARMQAIAAEFNLSETVFVFEPRNAINTARVRIFTPKRELPFAGHPTVGTAALIAHRRARDLLAAQDLRIVLEEAVGDVVCSARHRQGQALAAYFELPKLPERLDGKPPSKAEIAAGLGLEPADIGFGAHEPSLYSAGAPYLFVPVRSLERDRPRSARRDGLGDQGRSRDLSLHERSRTRWIGVSRAHVRSGVGSDGRSRRPAAPPPPSPALFTLSTARATVSIPSRSSKASRWAGQA